jgi:hypothetical protein
MTNGRKKPPSENDSFKIDTVSASQLIDLWTVKVADIVNQKAADREAKYRAGREEAEEQRRARARRIMSWLGLGSAAAIFTLVIAGINLVEGFVRNETVRLDTLVASTVTDQINQPAFTNRLGALSQLAVKDEIQSDIFRGDLRNAINAAVENIADERLSAAELQMTDAELHLTELTRYLEFLAMSTRLEPERSTADEREHVLLLMIAVFENNTIISQGALLNDMEKVIDLLHLVEDDARILRVDDAFGKLLRTHRGITWTMVHFHGRRLLASSDAALAESEVWQNFGIYENAGARHQLETESLPYRILGEFELAGRTRNDRVTSLVLSIRSLGFGSGTFMETRFQRLRDAMGSSGVRIAELVAEFDRVYGEDLTSILTENSCQYAFDSECDEPSLCALGTDTNDCRNAGPDSCLYANDGACQGLDFCLPGSDTTDCS